MNFIRTEPDVMDYWLWLGTALGTGLALFSSAVSAVSSVLKSASATRKNGTMVVLIISNATSALSQIFAFVCWLTQFYKYLTNNVLAMEDISYHWYSTNMAYLGYSFYFIVAGIIIVIINIIILITVIKYERREKRRVEPPCDEKTQGAIMLY